MLLKTQTRPKNLLVVILAFTLAFSCGCNSSSTASDSSGDAAPRNPDGIILIRGSVMNVSAKKIIVKTNDSSKTILLGDSLHLYARSPSSFANVKSTSFIGVTTQQQADGSDQATEIHIFPEELRGLGEGSFMMDAQTGSNNRMTNGAASRMTNGAASRMSNGNVQQADGSSLVIQYQGKSRTVKVPANIPVTAYTITNEKLSQGFKIVALAKKDANGNFSTVNILISGK
jgi:hypothetical protein